MQTSEIAIDAAKTVESFGHDSIEAYQEWYGLKPDGISGPKTTTHIVQPRCAVPDFMGAGQNAQWPKACMELTVSYNFDQIQFSQLEQAWDLALSGWSDNCGVSFLVIGDIHASDIWATDGALPGSTLAWSFLANNRCDNRIEQRYDTLVSWSLDFFVKTCMHELGHALGLEHSNDSNDLMYPSIQNKPFSAYPATGDKQKVVQRYGPNIDEPAIPTGKKSAVALAVSLQGALERFLV